jgi:hypothetical protein
VTGIMNGEETVVVEFYGIPRRRAGRAQLVVRRCVLAEVLAEVKQACPGLADLVQDDGRLAPQYLVSINGRRFTQVAEDRRLRPGDHVLLLSADAGG